jgi:hypothetical protein
MSEQDKQEGMNKRRITLADGRYLIFYTFDESPAANVVQAATGNPSRREEPEAEPEAAEERRV